MNEYKMFEAEPKFKQFIKVHNLNGIIEDKEELLRYINQAIEAGILVFGSTFAERLEIKRQQIVKVHLK